MRINYLLCYMQSTVETCELHRLLRPFVFVTIEPDFKGFPSVFVALISLSRLVHQEPCSVSVYKNALF